MRFGDIISGLSYNYLLHSTDCFLICVDISALIMAAIDLSPTSFDELCSSLSV